MTKMNKIGLTLVVLIISLFFTKADHGPQFQFINNSTHPGAQSVDIWYTWDQFASSGDSAFSYYVGKVAEDLNYKEATPYIQSTLIYGDLIVYVTPAGSTDTTNAFYRKRFTDVDYDEFYTLVFSGDPLNGFECYRSPSSPEAIAAPAVSIKFYNGYESSTSLDFIRTDISSGTVVQDLAYGEHQAHVNLLRSNFQFALRNDNGVIIGEFDIPASILETNSVITLVAVGKPSSQNTNSLFPLRLLLVRQSGEVVEIGPNGAVSVEEWDQNIALSAYPNPASDRMNITFELSAQEDLQWSVMDATGRIVESHDRRAVAPGQHEIRLQTSSWSPGWYTFQCRLGSKLGYQRILVQ